jgi:hypothetical protein
MEVRLDRLFRRLWIDILATVGLVFLLLAPPAWGDTEMAKIYRDSKKPESLLFQFVRTNKENGDGTRQSRMVYSYPNGEVAVIEEAKFDATGGLLYFERQQNQIGEKGHIRVGSEIQFSYTRSGQDEKTDSEALAPNFLVGPMITAFVQKRWDQILSGDIIATRFGVLERLETVGFDYQKVREEKSGGTDIIVVRMKPSSFIIAALVDPLYFSFRKSDKRLLSIRGRVIPKIKEGGKFVDLDAELVFEDPVLFKASAR